jgi:hypothetical protein
MEGFQDYNQYSCKMEREMKIQEEICNCTERKWSGDYPWCLNMACLRSDEYYGRYRMVYSIIFLRGGWCYNQDKHFAV